MPGLEYEREFWSRGLARVAGIDEAGRGAWAGPVVAAAVILPQSESICEALCGVNDSKKLKASQRAALRGLIEYHASAYAIGSASHAEIDALGILVATRLAMRRAIEALQIQAEALLIDAVKLREIELPQRAFNFADSISLSVAAASILAKTERDAMMQTFDATHTGYSFGRHKGYGTKAHQAALKALGACQIHRKSFRPIKNHVEQAR
ncbi:MAG: ribonuclease HII [Anaerolineae bacterium]|nr:ribonuclease HII [Anaerolineae bacterium]